MSESFKKVLEFHLRRIVQTVNMSNRLRTEQNIIVPGILQVRIETGQRNSGFTGPTFPCHKDAPVFSSNRTAMDELEPTLPGPPVKNGTQRSTAFVIKDSTGVRNPVGGGTREGIENAELNVFQRLKIGMYPSIVNAPYFAAFDEDMCFLPGGARKGNARRETVPQTDGESRVGVGLDCKVCKCRRDARHQCWAGKAQPNRVTAYVVKMIRYVSGDLCGAFSSSVDFLEVDNT